MSEPQRPSSVDYAGARRRRRRAATSRSGASASPMCKLQDLRAAALLRGFLRGRHFTEAPDITARICGICPIAYQMSAVHAMERRPRHHGRSRRAGAAPPVLLRRVDREPRAARLHAACARLPGLSRMRSRMAKDHREVVQRGLQLKKIGNAHRRRCWAGARFIRSRRRRRFYQACRRSASCASSPSDLKWARDWSIETVAVRRRSRVPRLRAGLRVRRARHPDEYPFNEGRLVSNRGLDIDAAEYDDHFHRAARAALERAALRPARARLLPGRPAGALST